MTKDEVIRRLRVLGGREPGPNVFDTAADMLLALPEQQREPTVEGALKDLRERLGLADNQS